MVTIEKPSIYMHYKLDKCGRGKPLSLNLTLMYVWCLNSNCAAKLIQVKGWVDVGMQVDRWTERQTDKEIGSQVGSYLDIDIQVVDNRCQSNSFFFPHYCTVMWVHWELINQLMGQG